jgi:NAD(P)-dependent dehydrogenase (short-subunit alcohol dehydrogenase family)
MTDRPLLLVTGGGRGIGAAVCRLAAPRGYDLVVNYRSDKAAAETLAEACRADGAAVTTVAADLSREEDVTRLFEAVDEAGHLTHLVNNAGITGRSSSLVDTPTAVIRETIDINVTGAILVAREAVRRMTTGLGARSGAIVNISSAAATLGSPGEYIWYAASKGAIDSFTIGLAKEVAAQGIRVNSVQPGLTETEIHERSTGDPARVERIRPLIPLQRVGQPAEVAEAILFLLSDAASYITGSILRVAGGR